jgi:hypothetical protein
VAEDGFDFFQARCIEAVEFADAKPGGLVRRVALDLAGREDFR